MRSIWIRCSPIFVYTVFINQTCSETFETERRTRIMNYKPHHSTYPIKKTAKVEAWPIITGCRDLQRSSGQLNGASTSIFTIQTLGHVSVGELLRESYDICHVGNKFCIVCKSHMSVFCEYRHFRIRVGETFEAMETSRSAFK